MPRLRVLLMAMMLGGCWAEAAPVTRYEGGAAPDLLIDRLRVVFREFEERSVMGEPPEAVTVDWQNVRYTLLVEDWWDYRSGAIPFRELVAKVRVEKPRPFAMERLWALYRFPAAVAGGVLMVLLATGVGVAGLRVRRRRSQLRQASFAGNTAPGIPVPLPPSLAGQQAPVLSLWPQTGGAIPLSKQCTALGFQEGNDIRIAGRGVAPFHCRIWRMPDGAVFLEDLGSPAGCRLNGVPVSREWLQPGLVLALGEWQARVDWWSPAPQ